MPFVDDEGVVHWKAVVAAVVDGLPGVVDVLFQHVCVVRFADALFRPQFPHTFSAVGRGCVVFVGAHVKPPWL